ncbi:MAG: NAD(+) synthase [Pirellulales bacterium]
MHLIRVGGAALNQTPLDWNGNRDRLITAIRAARDRQVSILCLPELAITGYGCEDAFLSPGLHRMALQVLAELLPETRGLVVALGLPVRFESCLYDTVCLVADGRVAGFVAKQHLAGEGIHYEPRWFRPWPRGRRGHVEIDLGDGPLRVPFGDVRFDVDGVRIGFEICEDAWAASRPGSDLAARGVDLILNPSASHFAFAKEEVRRRFVLEGSRAFGVTYVYANLLGNEAGRSIYDGSVLVASNGRMLAEGRRFSFDDCLLTDCIVDMDVSRLSQSKLAGVPGTAVDEPVDVPFVLPRSGISVRPVAARDAWESGRYVKEEEFARAVALGLFDYVRKSRSRGFVVSASGGADSSAVACLAAAAVKFAVAELGAVVVARRLGLAPGPHATMSDPSVEQLIRQSLTCVYQATANSGEVTRHAAETLAESLGAAYHEFDVEAIVQQYRRLVESALGRPLSWEYDDLALQNIQARVRSPGVWMLANVTGALLLSTSNRSEAAVGYATMDGDTSGGLAPIAGIDKAFLRAWLEWMQVHGPQGLGPLPSLEAVNTQQPTAELRPPAAGQTDEADLMPYAILDLIERFAIRDKQMPLACWTRLCGELPTQSPRQLAVWTERFFRLWSRNQWKRERYAPSFHLDDENLDPKTWCRFPILSGGFERELGELRAAAGLDA